MRLRLRIFLLLCLLFVSLLVGCGSDAEEDTLGEEDTLTVMTYNVYVGGNLEALFGQLGVLPPDQIARAAHAIYDQVVNKATFSLRAEAIADAIATDEPHFVGLQEMALIRTGEPDSFLGGPPNAATIVLDFREVLKAELASQGLNYSFDYEIQNADVELPMHDGGSFFKDGRLTLFDVLLVRDDVEVSNHDAWNYFVFLQPPIAPLEVKRGYVTVEASVAGRTYRVVNTHLEAAVPQIRNAQAAELMAYLEEGNAPTILLGDFNSSPDIEAGIDDHDTYLTVTGAGFVDMWKGAPGTGFTCCQDPDLTGEGSLSKRIDFVFVRNALDSGATFIDTDADDAFIVGDRPSDRVTRNDGTLLWPSDHAGVGAVLYVD